MTEATIQVDLSRPVDFSLPGQRAYPLLIDGAQVMAVISDAECASLKRMVSVIRTKNPSYSDDDALIWAAGRALSSRRLAHGVLHIQRGDV